jgi:hypothetical protein
MSFEKQAINHDRLIVDFNDKISWWISCICGICLILFKIDNDISKYVIVAVRFIVHMIWFWRTYLSYGYFTNLLWDWAYVFKSDFVLYSSLRMVMMLEEWYISKINDYRQEQTALQHAMYDDYDDSDYGIDQQYVDMLHRYRYTRRTNEVGSIMINVAYAWKDIK